MKYQITIMKIKANEIQTVYGGIEIVKFLLEECESMPESWKIISIVPAE